MSDSSILVLRRYLDPLPGHKGLLGKIFMVNMSSRGTVESGQFRTTSPDMDDVLDRDVEQNELLVIVGG